METMTEERKETMGRATALGVLARMAYDRSLSIEEVTALQMAVRCIAKRHFDAERNWKRRHAAAALPPPAGVKSSEVEKLKSPEPFNLSTLQPSTPADEGGEP